MKLKNSLQLKFNNIHVNQIEKRMLFDCRLKKMPNLCICYVRTNMVIGERALSVFQARRREISLQRDDSKAPHRNQMERTFGCS